MQADEIIPEFVETSRRGLRAQASILQGRLLADSRFLHLKKTGTNSSRWSAKRMQKKEKGWRSHRSKILNNVVWLSQFNRHRNRVATFLPSFCKTSQASAANQTSSSNTKSHANWTGQEIQIHIAICSKSVKCRTCDTQHAYFHDTLVPIARGIDRKEKEMLLVSKHEPRSTETLGKEATQHSTPRRNKNPITRPKEKLSSILQANSTNQEKTTHTHTQPRKDFSH